MSRIDVADMDGVRVVNTNFSTDSRGVFLKNHPDELLQSRLGSVAISINPTIGTIRGIHFQVEPYAEEKIVSCIQGSILEVIVDLRPGSKSLGKIATFKLEQSSAKQVYLPKGIAHGFQTLQSDTIVQYFLTSEYSPHHSYAINPFGQLGVDWPIRNFLVSEKDAGGISLPLAQSKYAESILSE